MLDKKEVPQFLYKYRPPCIEQILAIIAEGKLWAADPDSFNDPFDCYPYTDTSLIKSESVDWVSNFVSVNNIADKTKKKKFIRNIENKNRRENFTDKKKKEEWKKSLGNFGVVCLSEDNSNILMWSHYAASHTGVCIEISTKDSNLKCYEKVIYNDKRPTFIAYQKANPINREMIKQALLNKAKAWEYEKEWRHFISNAEKREVLIPKKSIRRIFLGIRIEESFKEKLKSEIALNKLDVELIQLYQDSKCYKLYAKNFTLSNSTRPINKFTCHKK